MAENIGCKEHADSPIWSHLLVTVKIFLGWLEKQIQKKFCQNPRQFTVCKTSDLQVVNHDSIEWYPLYLTDFASYLESGDQSGP